MSKHIFKYADQAAYIADSASRPAQENVASAIGVDPKFEGVNIIADFDAPGKCSGDSVYWDTILLKKVLVKAGTLEPLRLDTARYINLNSTCVGHIYGKDVFVDDRQLAAERYASGDEWKLSGFDLTSAGSATITFKYYSATGTYVKDLTLSWAAGAAISTVSAQISAATGIKDYNKPFAIDDTSFGVEVHGYSANIGLTLVEGDITVERTYRGYQTQYYPGLPYDTQIQRRNNTLVGSVFVQAEKASEYYATSGVLPTTTVTLDSDFVTRAAFKTDEYCADMRRMFCADPSNPTDAEYVDYIYTSIEKRKNFRYPSTRSSNYKFAFGDNFQNSTTMAQVSHERCDGQTIWDFPNARSAFLQGTTVQGAVTGFEPGTGHLGGIAEAALLYNQITKAQTDTINVAIAKKSGNKVAYNTTIRLAFQSSSNIAWIFGGSYGSLNYGNIRYSSFAARVFRAF